MSKLIRVGLVLALAATPAMALQYETIVPWSQMNGTGSSNGVYSVACEGQTLYSALTFSQTGATGPRARITKVTNLNGVQQTVELMSPQTWYNATGKEIFTPIYGFNISGNYLQFTDTGTDQVYRVNKGTGEFSTYVSLQSIKDYTGLLAGNLNAGHDTNAVTGELAFYESESKQILVTTGQNSVTTLVSSAMLQALAGAGGNPSTTSLGFAADGTMFWGNGNVDELYMRAPDGTINTLLTGPEISAVTQNSSVGFKDMFPAPDGKVYFQESSSTHIMRFSPDNPAATLEVFLSKDDLLNGPAANTNVYQLTWYDGRLGFNVWNTQGAKGFYAVVPEPATLSLLAVGGLAVLRRRSR